MTCGGKTFRRLDAQFDCPPIDTNSLEETGRLQFFYHSPDSPLPVRDVLNKHGKGPKKEPHLEKSAENYCVPCLQSNIRGFLKSKEKYLFLLTRRSGVSGDRERYIVGYLMKKRALPRSRRNEKGKIEHHWAVQGPITLVSFGHALPLNDLSGMTKASARRGTKRLDMKQTREVLAHLSGRPNIFRACLREVRRLNRIFADRGRDASCHDTRRN